MTLLCYGLLYLIAYSYEYLILKKVLFFYKRAIDKQPETMYITFINY